MFGSSTVGCLFLTSALLWSLPSWSQNAEIDARADARRIGYAGIEAYHQGNYAEAERQLNRAYALLPAPSLALWSARALVKSGKLVEAAARYAAGIAASVDTGEADVQRSAQADAAHERAQLLPRVPRLDLQLVNADWHEVTVSIDGRAVDAIGLAQPFLLNPGAHVITGRRGVEGTSVTVSLELGRTESAVLRFAPRQAKRTRGEGTWLRPLTYVGWGAGVLGIGAYGVLRALAAADEQIYRTDCASVAPTADLLGPGICLPSTAERRKAAYERTETLADVGLIAGIVGASTGTVLWLVTDGDESSIAQQRLTAGLSLAGVSAAALTSAALFALSSSSRHENLKQCTPFCSDARVAAADRRDTLALVSLGAGTLAAGAAAWVLLSGGEQGAQAIAVPTIELSWEGGATGGGVLVSTEF